MNTNTLDWTKQVIKQDEIDRYLKDGKDFINDDLINEKILNQANPEKQYIKDIIKKSLSIERLTPDETAALINVKDEELWQEMFEAAGKVKRTVYDNRIVTFAPLYCSNLCVNSCLYCGFKNENKSEKRNLLSLDDIKHEAEGMIKAGHKRTIMVYGEHPSSSIDYIVDSVKAVYDVNVKSRKGNVGIRRVNINAAPMSIADLKRLKEAGIGTYQVFQETYNHEAYKHYHPKGIKANYRWRLYALHRAFEAGIDDVATGALFGLHDWRFEVMGLLYHAIDLEEHFDGIGPHTISFPRVNSASGGFESGSLANKVSDEDFKKLVTIIRLSVPYTGMIITARESAEMRRQVIPLGCTQTDASTKIGVGSYSEKYNEQEKERQQFMLGDTRGLDEVIEEFAKSGYITSFCTAGYRCGRTGDTIMDLLKCGAEGKFCKLNAVLTFREWLDDFATEETKKAGEIIIQKELDEINNDPFYEDHDLMKLFKEYLERVSNGERDLYL